MSNSTVDNQEIRPKNILKKYGFFALGAILILASLIIQARLMPIVSVDYTASLSHWMNALETNPRLSAFKYPFANYAPLYLYFLKVLTLIPIYHLYSIKGLTILFNIALGVISALIVYRKREQFGMAAPTLFLVAAIVFSIPTVILNGAAWAQVDAAYTTFVLLSLYFILRDKPLAATIAFGIAFSFKLQSIFFAPVLVGYLLSRFKQAWYLLLIPVIFALTVVPAWLSGGSFVTWSTMYVKQSQESPLLTRSAPSMYAILYDSTTSAIDHPLAPKIGFALAFIAAALVVVAVARFHRTHYKRNEALVALSLISVLAIPFFLPYMHERYFFMADVLSIILVFYRPYLILIPAAVIMASFYSYMPFLSATVKAVAPLIIEEEEYLGGLMFLALSLLIIWFLYRRYSINKFQHQ